MRIKNKMSSDISLLVIVVCVTISIMLIVAGVWYYRKYYRKVTPTTPTTTDGSSDGLTPPVEDPSNTSGFFGSSDETPNPLDGTPSSAADPNGGGTPSSANPNGGRGPSANPNGAGIGPSANPNGAGIGPSANPNGGRDPSKGANGVGRAPSVPVPFDDDDDNNTSHLSTEEEERMRARSLARKEAEEKKKRAESLQRAEALVKQQVEELERNISDRTRKRDELRMELERLNTECLKKEEEVREQQSELDRITRMIEKEEEQFKSQDEQLRQEEENLKKQIKDIELQEQKKWDELIQKAIVKIKQGKHDNFDVKCMNVPIVKVDRDQYVRVTVNKREAEHDVATGIFQGNLSRIIRSVQNSIYNDYFYYSIYKDIYLVKGKDRSINFYFYCVFQDNDTNKTCNVFKGVGEIPKEKAPFLRFPILPCFETKNEYEQTVQGYYSESGDMIRTDIPFELHYYIDNQKKECYLYYMDDMGIYYYGMLNGKLTKYTYENSVKPSRNVMVDNKPYRLQDQNLLVER
jgi:hypothetical protein